MTEKIQLKLSESALARWSVLALISFTMLCGYFITDVMAPLKPMLEEQLGWDSGDYGFFTSAYGWFNVFLFMLIFGGMALDHYGVKVTGIGAATIMLLGMGIKYWAVSKDFNEETVEIFGTMIDKQVMYASIGFAIFGVGIETVGITVSKIIVKWFKGKELALAMGLEMACARLGTFAALLFTVPIAKATGSINHPLLLGFGLLCIGLLSFVVFAVMDKKRDDELKDTMAKEEPFKFRDILDIISIKGFWYIAILCVLFYSAVFPFLKYAPDLMYHKFNISESLSGIIPSLLPIGTLFLTPFFGNLYDKKGKGASIMLLGSCMLIFVHFIFAIPFLDHWSIALILTLILGIAFSLVPSAMWPSVPKIVPENKLGTAYSLIFWLQNWGLMGVPYLIGIVLEKYCITENISSRNSYDYTLPMIIFGSLGLLSIVFAYLLKKEDKKMGYGLELPNITK